MHEDFFRALEAGASIVTAGRRLARVLTGAYHTRQRSNGRTVWSTPDILPLNAFLARAWRDYVFSSAQPCATLLDAAQEQALWEQVIRESPAGDSLLRIPETAQQAIEAWQMVQAYRLPVDERFEASDDWSAFAGWTRAFRKRCAANDWLEPARLADVIADLARKGDAAKPARLFLAGFEDLTPQQSELFEALGGWSAVETTAYNGSRQLYRYRDSTEEIRAAAAWARRILEQNPSAQIGVAIPDLTKTRAKVERVFRDALQPGAPRNDSPQPFHVSLGPALSQYPVVHAALLALEFAAGRLDLPHAGMLLRSEFLGGASAEWTRRAQIDAKFRRDGVWDVSPAFLRDRAAKCPELQRLLARFEKRLRQLPREQAASGWSQDFSKLLEALEWPGDRTLDSREHQVVEKWNGLLTSFASLDVATPPLSVAEALSRLRELADASPFQIENEGAPVQIMGLLEASGLRFDHLWVMGLHDETMPGAARPNPFLPISLQREHELPHSSPERELDFAKRQLASLSASARQVALSYPASDGDRMLGPSPLVEGEWRDAPEVPRQSEFVRRVRAAAAATDLHDEVAPPLVAASQQTGGASVFKDMSACAFRAFAKHRLAARPLEESVPGVSYSGKGTAVHKAMATIWSELGSLARLLELGPEELRELISRAAAAAVQQLGIGLGRNLEKQRLERVLAEWMEIEKLRDPFAVRATEQDNIVSIGGLQVKIRADRVDRLPDGREIILDYKTGKVKSKAWQSERPDEPQLPLYCATSTEPIAGAAFVVVRVDERKFRGLTEDDAKLPEFRRMEMEAPAPLDARIEEWRRVLERLAVRFRDGAAEVDPKPAACDHCGLRALCRIREFENEHR